MPAAPDLRSLCMRPFRFLAPAFLILSACGTPPQAPPEPDQAATPAAPAVGAPPVAVPSHLGVWYWAGSLGADGHVSVVDASRYELDFREDGSLRVRADCNRGMSSYMLHSRYQLEIAPVGLTKMGCPADSQDSSFLRQLAAARALGAGAEWMLVDLRDDLGVMHLARSAQATLRGYRCADGRVFHVGYTEGSVRLMAGERVMRLEQVPAASGLRFEAAGVVLHSKGEEALLSGLDGESGACQVI